MCELVSAYPTAGGIYWWASELGGAAWGWFTGWFNLVGLVAVAASVDYGCATFISTLLNLWSVDLGFVNFADGAVAGRRVHRLHAGARAPRADQHLLLAPRRAVQQRLGVVARRGRRGDHRDPDLRPRATTRARLRLHRDDQQLGLQPGHVLVLRAAARLPADAVHDHRLRRLGAHLRGDARRRGGGAEGRLALRLLLGADRLGPAAGAHLRGDRHGRDQRRAAAARWRSSTARCRTPRPSS